VSHVLLVGVDLFFRAKIDAMLGRAGHTVTARPDEAAPDLVIADVGRTEPAEVLAAHPGVPVLGFGAHTDPARLRAARQAGFALAVPRSTLAADLPRLAEDLLGYTGAPTRERPGGAG
jgi:hypothetical protein